MTTEKIRKFETEWEQLTIVEQVELLERMIHKLTTCQRVTKNPNKPEKNNFPPKELAFSQGSMQSRFIMSPDFDDIPDDFKDYI